MKRTMCAGWMCEETFFARLKPGDTFFEKPDRSYTEQNSGSSWYLGRRVYRKLEAPKPIGDMLMTGEALDRSGGICADDSDIVLHILQPAAGMPSPMGVE